MAYLSALCTFLKYKYNDTEGQKFLEKGFGEISYSNLNVTKLDKTVSIYLDID